MRFRIRLGVLILALACHGELIDGGLPPGGNEPPTPFTPGLALRVGGTGADVIRAMRIDPSGNVLVAGTFTGVTTTDGLGGSPLTSLGGTDGFLAKYSSTGALVWSRRFGGTQDELVTDLALDAGGNIFVGGSFQGVAGFDLSGAGVVLTSTGGEDGFVAKFSSDGALLWVRRFGGAGPDQVSALSADGSGNVFAAGGFTGPANALPAPGPTIQSGGGRDGFVLALGGDGAVRWAIPLGGPQDDAALGIAATASGDIAVAGEFHGTADFARGGGTATFLTALGGADVFLAFYSGGGTLVRAVRFGGTGEESVSPGGLSADASGNTILLGSFSGSVDFDPGPGVVARASLGPVDLFASRFDAAGSFQSTITLGGPSGSITGARAVAAPDGGTLITGRFTGAIDFDPGPGISMTASLGLQGVTDAFVGRYRPSGGLAWVSRFGEATLVAGRGTAGTGLALDPAGNPLVAGYFTGSPDFDPGTTAFRLTTLGEADGFLVKLTSTGALAP
jgi:hypothetical protein